MLVNVLRWLPIRAFTSAALFGARPTTLGAVGSIGIVIGSPSSRRTTHDDAVFGDVGRIGTQQLFVLLLGDHLDAMLVAHAASGMLADHQSVAQAVDNGSALRFSHS